MDEAAIKQIMPHSIDAEQSVVGSMLTDKDALLVATESLDKDDFYGKQYGVLFDAMKQLNNEGKNVDPITLNNKLSQMDIPGDVNGMEYVREVVNSSYTSANIKQYCEIVKGKALLRKLIKLNNDITNACYDQKDSVENIFEETEKKVFEIVQKRNTGDYVPIADVVMNAIDQIEAASRAKGTVTGVASGFVDLDYYTTGFQRSDFILIAARPSMGKTAFVLNVADNICFRQKKAAVIFSLEMSKEQLVNRLLAQESNVDSQHIRTGQLQDQEWVSLMEGAGIISDSRLIIDDTPNISIGELRSKCRKYKLDHDIDIIIIDYLQLMSGSGKSDSRQQEISDISRALKALARELDVPVIALSQLSRAVEKREDHRPILSDLRESGAIEQDADLVMFLYRDDYYNKESPKQNIAEVIIAKQRRGPIGTVELVWLSQFTKFANKEKTRSDNVY